LARISLILILISATLMATAAQAQDTMQALALADPLAQGFGVGQFYIGAQVEPATLESLGFTLDDYYAPDTVYSKPVNFEFTYGMEEGRLDIGVDNGEIYQIIVEFNNMFPSDDGNGLNTRENLEQLLTAVAELLDARYSDWSSEQWSHEDDVLHVDIMDMYNEDYALSFRISMLANTLIYTWADERQTKDDPWGDEAAPDDAKQI
jgi:hypothetical protein